MRRLRFNPATRYEVCEAACYLESRKEGLGHLFRAELKRVLSAIRDNPESFGVYREPVRSGRLRGFSYRVLFRVEAEHVEIVAVMNLHRNPDYWLDRL